MEEGRKKGRENGRGGVGEEAYIGVKYMEDEFEIIGNASDCQIMFNKAPQLFTYVVEIISKSSIYISPTRYGLTYIS